MMNILLVDDMRNFPERENAFITTIRGSEDAIAWLEDEKMDSSFELDEIWLDFDLGGGDTVMPVALYLAEQAFYGTPYPVDAIYIHSANPVGRKAMYLLLTRYGYCVDEVDAHFGV